MTLHILGSITLQSRKSSSYSSHRTLSRICHSKCSPFIWWKNKCTLPLLMKSSVITKAQLKLIKMNKTLHHHPSLGCIQTLRTDCLRKRKRPKKKTSPSLPMSLKSSQLKCQKYASYRDYSMTTKLIETVWDQEEWARLSSWLQILIRCLVTRATVWQENPGTSWPYLQKGAKWAKCIEVYMKSVAFKL